MKHKRPLHCAPNHEYLEFFRGFHLSELGMDVLKVTHSIPILHWTFFRFLNIVTLFKWDLCSNRVKTKSSMPKAWFISIVFLNDYHYSLVLETIYHSSMEEIYNLNSSKNWIKYSMIKSLLSRQFQAQEKTCWFSFLQMI